jgi:hypothetical protein
MNHSPYLDRPLLPLAVALPRMLEKIEVDLATAGPAETRRLRERAELIRGLLPPTAITPAPRPRAGFRFGSALRKYEWSGRRDRRMRWATSASETGQGGGGGRTARLEMRS